MVDECRVVGHLRPDDGEYLVDDLVLDIVEYEQSPVRRSIPHVVRGLPKGDCVL